MLLLKFMRIRYSERLLMYMRKEYAIEIWSRKIFCVILIRMFWGCAISEAQNNW